MKFIFIIIAIFCFVHIHRDYLQIKGVKNRFTEIGHIWHAPEYEKHGMVVAFFIGLVFIYLAYSY